MRPRSPQVANRQLRHLRWRLLSAVERTRVGQQRERTLPLSDRLILAPILLLIHWLLILAVNLVSLRVYFTTAPQTAFSLYARKRGQTFIDSYTSFVRSARITLAVVAVTILAVIGGVILGLSLHQFASGNPGRVWHIGILRRGAVPSPTVASFKKTLTDRGWQLGKNIDFEERANAVTTKTLEAQAAEYVRDGKDLILAIGEQPAAAAKAATRQHPTPVLFVASLDPVQEGLIRSYTTSGNNLVGVGQAGLVGRQLDLMKKLQPRLTTVGILAFPNDDTNELFTQAVKHEAQTRGLIPMVQTVTDVADLPGAMQAIAAHPPSAVYLAPGVFLNNHIDAIAQAATDHHLLSMGTLASNAAAGATLSLYANLDGVGETLAQMADQIFSGASPATMSSTFAGSGFLALNQKTAAAIGLAWPPDIIAQADAVY